MKIHSLILLLFSLAILVINQPTLAKGGSLWDHVGRFLHQRGAPAETCGDNICSTSARETCLSCPSDCCPHDACINAKQIDTNKTDIGSVFGAQNASADLVPFCVNNAPDLWYFFTPDSNGILVVSTCNPGTTGDTTLGIFAAPNNSSSATPDSNATLSCDNLIQIACKDDDLLECARNPVATTIQLNVVQGHTYLIRVAPFSNQNLFGYIEMSFTFNASSSVPTPVCGDDACDILESCSSCPQDCCNDNCSDPFVVSLSSSEGSTNTTNTSNTLVFIKEGSTQGATLESDVPSSSNSSSNATVSCVSNPSADVWFVFTPDQDGLLQVDTCVDGATTFDTTLSLYTINSTVLPPASTTAPGGNGTSGGTPPPLDNTTSIDCTQLTLLECNDDGGTIECINYVKASNLWTKVIAEQQYVIRLAGKDGAVGHFGLRFRYTPGNFTSECGDGICTQFLEDCSNCKQDCCPNDLCTNALAVDLTNSTFSFVGNTYNATEDLTVPIPVFFCAHDSPDAWFELTPASSGPLTISTCSNVTNFDTTIAVFRRSNATTIPPTSTGGNATNNTTSEDELSSSCGSLKLVTCNDDFRLGTQNCSVNLFASQVSFNASSGENYLIRVGGFSTASFGYYQITFSSNITTNATTPPTASSSAPPATTTSAPPGTTASPPTTVEVAGTDFSWTPATITIRAGDSVHWSWTGTHNVAETESSTSTTASAGGFRSGPCCATDSEFTHTFPTPGTFEYICEAHVALGMRGTVTVT